MIADALQVLGAEQKVRAGADVARIFHHVGQEFAEQRGVQGVDLVVGAPDGQCCPVVAGLEGGEYVIELHAHAVGELAEASEADDGRALLQDGEGALGEVLGKVADALEIVGDAERGDDLPEVGGHGLPARDGGDRLLLEVVLEVVDRLVGGDDLLGDADVAVLQGEGGEFHRARGAHAHIEHDGGQFLEVVVEGCDGVRSHAALLRVRAGECGARASARRGSVTKRN